MGGIWQMLDICGAGQSVKAPTRQPTFTLYEKTTMTADQKYNDLGRQLFFEQVRAGNSCLPVLRKTFGFYGQPSFQVFVGAMSAAMGLLESTFERGVRFRSDDAHVSAIIQKSPANITIDLNRSFDNNDLLAVAEVVLSVAGAVDGLRGKITIEPDTKQPTGPLEVVVKSMPARTTETTIARDDNGSIVASTQVERDAA